jgi:hypothetical protein
MGLPWGCPAAAAAAVRRLRRRLRHARLRGQALVRQRQVPQPLHRVQGLRAVHRRLPRGALRRLRQALLPGPLGLRLPALRAGRRRPVLVSRALALGPRTGPAAGRQRAGGGPAAGRRWAGGGVFGVFRPTQSEQTAGPVRRVKPEATAAASACEPCCEHEECDAKILGSNPDSKEWSMLL